MKSSKLTKMTQSRINNTKWEVPNELEMQECVNMEKNYTTQRRRMGGGAGAQKQHGHYNIMAWHVQG